MSYSALFRTLQYKGDGHMEGSSTKGHGDYCRAPVIPEEVETAGSAQPGKKRDSGRISSV